MAAQNLVLVTRTDNGKQFKVSTNKIVQFKALQNTTTLLTYVDQRGRQANMVVNETASTINGLTGSRTQAVTLYPSGTTVYINSDRIIYLDITTYGTIITYEVSGGSGKYNLPPSLINVSTSASSISSTAGQTGVIITSASQTRYINGNFIDLVTHSPLINGDYEVLYDSKKTSFEKITVSSNGASSFSIGSGWS